MATRKRASARVKGLDTEAATANNLQARVVVDSTWSCMSSGELDAVMAARVPVLFKAVGAPPRWSDPDSVARAHGDHAYHVKAQPPGRSTSRDASSDAPSDTAEPAEFLGKTCKVLKKSIAAFNAECGAGSGERESGGTGGAKPALYMNAYEDGGEGSGARGVGNPFADCPSFWRIDGAAAEAKVEADVVVGGGGGGDGGGGSVEARRAALFRMLEGWLSEHQQVNKGQALWLSCSPVVTSTHTDAYDTLGLLATYGAEPAAGAAGCKEWWLAPPHVDCASVPMERVLPNTSALRPWDPPSYRNNPTHAALCAQFSKVTVEAGDCLYVPAGWWHAVVTTGSMAAVTWWWRDSTPEALARLEEDQETMLVESITAADNQPWQVRACALGDIGQFTSARPPTVAFQHPTSHSFVRPFTNPSIIASFLPTSPPTYQSIHSTHRSSPNHPLSPAPVPSLRDDERRPRAHREWGRSACLQLLGLPASP